ncbi:SRPBCC family protein [Nocardia sp. NPDC088792]|uniref:SRPBCC family protein n=1 Tax=Nocardia sp. NPDC088792 TaxID=3364332 RepID=UPI00382DB3DA
MPLTSFLHTQHAATPLDDSVFDTAALVFKTEYRFDAPPSAVWTALDDDHAWKWLPFPGVGVRYDSPARGVGVVREMGSVFDPWRFGWIEREHFWRYEPNKRITFGVVSGNWSQYLLVRQYAEDVTFDEIDGGGTKLVWTVAVTPRGPLRAATWFPPAWKLAYHIGFGPGMRKRLRALAAGQPTLTPVPPNGARAAATSTTGEGR